MFAASDAARNLTERGRADVVNTLSVRSDALKSVNCIIASPYVRAQQTAAIAAEYLSLPVTTEPCLVPESSLFKLQQMLEPLLLEESDRVPLLVSHQPLVGSLVDWFCGLQPGYQVMGTSALAELQFDVVAASCADLLSLQQPR